jgi:hypothetical protein
MRCAVQKRTSQHAVGALAATFLLQCDHFFPFIGFLPFTDDRPGLSSRRRSRGLGLLRCIGTPGGM